MSRRVLLILLSAVLVIGGAAAALTFSARSALQDDEEKVDARWAPLRAPFSARYAGLDQVVAALDAAAAGDRSYTVDLRDELANWDTLADRGDPAQEAVSSNRLEGLAARIRTNVARSPRLSRDQGISDALAGFDTALVPAAEVEAYNRAVRRYQHTRTSVLRRLPAEILGYDSRPVLIVNATPE